MSIVWYFKCHKYNILLYIIDKRGRNWPETSRERSYVKCQILGVLDHMGLEDTYANRKGMKLLFN